MSCLNFFYFLNLAPNMDLKWQLLFFKTTSNEHDHINFLELILFYFIFFLHCNTTQKSKTGSNAGTRRQTNRFSKTRSPFNRKKNFYFSGDIIKSIFLHEKALRTWQMKSERLRNDKNWPLHKIFFLVKSVPINFIYFTSNNVWTHWKSRQTKKKYT